MFNLVGEMQNFIISRLDSLRLLIVFFLQTIIALVRFTFQISKEGKTICYCFLLLLLQNITNIIIIFLLAFFAIQFIKKNCYLNIGWKKGLWVRSSCWCSLFAVYKWILWNKMKRIKNDQMWQAQCLHVAWQSGSKWFQVACCYK